MEGHFREGNDVTVQCDWLTLSPIRTEIHNFNSRSVDIGHSFRVSTTRTRDRRVSGEGRMRDTESKRDVCV